MTVHKPSTEPITGPAIQDLLSGGVGPAVGRGTVLLLEVVVDEEAVEADAGYN